MTAGAQGHPGWVDNHPTSLKFLAASKACLHPLTFTHIAAPAIREESTSEIRVTTRLSKKQRSVAAESESSVERSTTPDVPAAATNSTSCCSTEAVPISITYQTNDMMEEYSKCYLNINPHIYIPQNVSELLLETACKHYPKKTNHQFFSLFRNTDQCVIQRADIRSSNATDESISFLLEHKLTHLDIRDCSLVTPDSIEIVSKKGKDLHTLAVSKSFFTRNGEGYTYASLECPKLRQLIINQSMMSQSFFSLTIGRSSLEKLSCLDLSSCEKINDLTPIVFLPLISLTLYSCNISAKWIDQICRIPTLRYLDISRGKSAQVNLLEPEFLLLKLINSLPHLSHLDISGTNLTGPKSTEAVYDNNWEVIGHCDIPALKSRFSRPLQVLGLCHTVHDACKWDNIPANKVLGDANETQILDTIKYLMPHKEQVTTALNELFHLFRYDRVLDVQLALSLIYQAMTTYHFDEHVQISGSASLFYIMRSEAERQQAVSAAARQQMVTLMINAMERFPLDNILMRNGCLTISQLKVPQQVLFEYERLVTLLLNLIRHRGTAVASANTQDRNMSDFVCRISIYLLNSLACQVEGFHKRLVGDLGAVETMLSLICDKLASKMHDDILELAWSVMWNVTDETPSNCQRFLDGQGMQYFSQCLHEFSEHEDLLRNMMGLLGNVAEVEALRCRLMTTELITTFTKLLQSDSGGIEVSYNAAGVLSHIASDGPDAWSISTPTRRSVLANLTSAIEKWDITVRRNINYRSFEPILRLLGVQHTAPCQHWAAWALANLTRVYPDKYCSLVVSEGGLPILEKVLSTRGVADPITDLVTTVIKHCTVYGNDGNLYSLYGKDNGALP